VASAQLAGLSLVSSMLPTSLRYSVAAIGGAGQGAGARITLLLLSWALAGCAKQRRRNCSMRGRSAQQGRPCPRGAQSAARGTGPTTGDRVLNSLERRWDQPNGEHSATAVLRDAPPGPAVPPISSVTLDTGYTLAGIVAQP